MKISNFSRANIKGLRNEIDEALDQVAKKYGITISAGNCTFSGNEANFKLKLNTIGEGGTVITRESQMWDLYKSRTNCSHLNVGDTITIQGNPYTLTGYNTRAKKAPIQFKDNGGNNYKCSIMMLNLKTLSNMKLQYIDQETVENFINGMDEVPTESILEDPQFSRVLKGDVPQQILDHDNPLGTLESFLQLFIDREEYEVCAKLVDKVPELKQY